MNTRQLLVLCLMPLLALSISCSDLSVTGGPRPLVQRALTTEAADTFSPLRVNQVAVFPLAGDALRGQADREQRVRQRLVSAFDLGTSLELLNRSRPQQASDGIASATEENKPLFSKAAQFGRRLGAQGVLCGVVNRLDTSDGAKYGADNPAAVQFRLWLIDPGSEQVLWSATYDKAEQPLSDNLFRLPQTVREGVEYRGAYMLLDQGFHEAAQAYQALRNG